MTAHDPTAAIAVLQAQQKQLAESFTDLQRQFSEGFAALNVKLDRFSDYGRDIVRLQERQEQHTAGMARAFDAIRGMEGVIDRCRRDHETSTEAMRLEFVEDVTALDGRVGALERKSEHAAGLVRGIWLVGSLVYTLLAGVGGALAWDLYTTQRDTAQRLQAVEIRTEAQR